MTGPSKDKGRFDTLGSKGMVNIRTFHKQYGFLEDH